MIQDQTIALSEWLPDLGITDNPGIIEAKNCIHYSDGFGQFLSPSVYATNVDLTDESDIIGSGWSTYTSNHGAYSNLSLNYFGRSNTIGGISPAYEMRQLDNFERPIVNAEKWEFEQFDDRMFAVDINNGLYYTTIGAVHIQYADQAPRARVMATVSDFLVLGDTLDNNGSQGPFTGPNFIEWSGYNNALIWGTSRSAQSDFNQLIGDGGRVQRIVPGTFGVIFQDHRIRKMEYVGPPSIFQIKTISNQSGTPAGGSVCWNKNIIYYYGWSGFYSITNGEQITPIGANKVDLWFKQEASIGAIEHMQATVDVSNNLVYWSYRSNERFAVNDKLLIYNIETGGWASANAKVRHFTTISTAPLSIDLLGSVFPGPIDNYDIPLDSVKYSKGDVQTAFYGEDSNLYTFSGPPMQAEFVTSDISSQAGRRLYTNALRPVVDGVGDISDMYVAVGKKERRGDKISYGIPRNVNGITEQANIRVSGKYQRVKLTIVNGFDRVKSIIMSGHAKGGVR